MFLHVVPASSLVPYAVSFRSGRVVDTVGERNGGDHGSRLKAGTT